MTQPLREGSLCTGYNGLGLATEAVLGCELAWYSEIEPAPSTLMGTRYEGVPNLGDLTTVDWATVEAVDVLTAGYPCQPFSQAGRRQGTDDERHLWPHIADAIAVLRPEWVLLENVRGHLSLGFDQVVADLGGLGYDAEWSLLRAADVGACHGRSRLFVVAHDRARGPALAPLGEPFALAEERVLVALQADLFGDAVAVAMPTAGSLRAAAVSVGQLVTVGDRFDGWMLPTPAAQEPGGTPEAHLERKNRIDGANRTRATHLSLVVPGLLPTPTTDPDSANGHARDLGSEVPRPLFRTPDSSSGRRSGDVKMTGRKPTDPQVSLHDQVDKLLPTPEAAQGLGGHERRGGDRGDELLLGGLVKTFLPTPSAADGERGPDYARNGRDLDGGRDASGGDDLVTTVARLLPTPTTSDVKGPSPNHGGTTSEAIRDVMLLPTPTTTGDGAQGPADPEEWEEWKAERASRGIPTGQGQLGTAIRSALLPTPNASDFRGATSPEAAKDWEQRGVNLPERVQRQRSDDGVAWGEYEPAIRRHEITAGRPAPMPVDDKGRLAPRFVEWMMLLPEGWVTDLVDHRGTALKMLGNGVVPLQAATAIAALAARLLPTWPA